MTRTIWKYSISLNEKTRVFIPVQSILLCAQTQKNIVCVWFQVNPENKLQERNFVVHGTGHEILKNEIYIGTTQISPFVWHVFEVHDDTH